MPAFEKILVFQIQFIFLEFSHPVLPVAKLLIQRPQFQRDLFFPAQYVDHCLFHAFVIPILSVLFPWTDVL